MQVNIRRLLPIGSIVKLKNANKKVMIIVNNILSETDKTIAHYDYSGCLYPEGVFDTTYNFLFNDADVEKIYDYGLITDEDFRIRLLVQNFAEGKELLFATEEEQQKIQKEIEVLDETSI